jgi:hypothetical protein
MKRAILVALVVCFVGAQSAAGQDAAKVRNALNNAQGEMIQCAAYFNVVAACMAVSNKTPSTIDAYRRFSDELLSRSIKLSETTGITADAMKSRYEMENKDHMALLQSNCVNISSLLSRYMDRCEFVATNFKGLVEEYMQRSKER